MNKITVKNIEINITGIWDDDYISLTASNSMRLRVKHEEIRLL